MEVEAWIKESIGSEMSNETSASAAY